MKRYLTLCSVLLCILTGLSLSLSFGVPPGSPQGLAPMAAVWVLGAAGLFFLYRAWLRMERPFGKISLWVLATVFAGVVTLAQSFAAVGTTELLTENAAALFKTVLFFVGRVPLYYVGMFLLTGWLGMAGRQVSFQKTNFFKDNAAHDNAVNSTADDEIKPSAAVDASTGPSMASASSSTSASTVVGSLKESSANPSHIHVHTINAPSSTQKKACAAYPSRMTAFLSSRWLWPALAAILLLCWLPYYLYTFPGVVSNDSVSQLEEIFGLQPLSNANPIFQTFLLWLCVQLAQPAFGADGAVALYCITQAVLLAALLGYLLMQMARGAAPHTMAAKADMKCGDHLHKQEGAEVHPSPKPLLPRWLFAASLLFFALCPIFPLYAFCVGKDTSFAMAVLLFSLMVWKVLRQPAGEKLPLRTTVGLCVSAVLVLLLRNPGVYLAGLTLALLLLWTLKKSRREALLWRAPTAALTSLLCVYAVLHLLVLPSLHAAPMPASEEYSIPLQQVARVVASQPESLTGEDIATISAVMDYGAIKGAYNGELSDPIKLLWREDATAAEKQTFFSLWLRLAPRHAATYFSATFHNTYAYLCPGYISPVKPTLLIGKQKHTTAIEPYFSFSIASGSDALKAAMDSVQAHPLGKLLLAPGLYGWLTLFAAVTLLTRRAGRRLLIAAFPAVFTLAGCFFSAVNGYFRYAMPLYFSAPFLLMLCAQVLFHEKGRCPTPKEAP